MKTTQFGWFLVVVFTPIIGFLLYQMYAISFFDINAVYALGGVSLILIVVALLFHKLTITIDDQYLKFGFGFNFYTQKYRLDEIQSCKPVKNPIWYGIGIRILPEGMLYNVSGLQAIELTFKNKKKKVRIGTDQPDIIAQYVNSRISKQLTPEIAYKTGRSTYYIFMSIMIAVIAVPVFMIIYGMREPQIELAEKGFAIKGMYGITLSYTEIQYLDTVTDLPKIRIRTNGFAFSGVCKGNFTLDSIGSAKLFVNCNTNLYIRIKTHDLKSIYLNFDDRQKTIEVFNNLTENNR